MIYANIELIIKRGETIAKNTLYLYRGDRNVEARFILKDNQFIVEGSTFAQLIIKRPSEPHIFSKISKIDNKTVVFLITGDMIDELKEVGLYDIQIRLYDDNQQARVTLPPVYEALEVREPIATNVEVGAAIVGDVSIVSTEEEGNYFDEEGNYNSTEWKDGDIISDYRLNKIEGALSVINDKIPSHKKFVTEEELESKGYLTEHQSLEGYATEKYVDEEIKKIDVTTQLGDYAKKSELPTKTSQLTNDSNFLTSIPSEYVTEAELNSKGYLTQHQDISGKADKTELHSHSNKSVLDGITSAKVTEWNNKSTFDGNYNSLTNKPTIPTKTSQLTNDSGFLTQHQDLSDYAKKTEIPTVPTNISAFTNDKGYITGVPSEYVTETELNAKGYLTEHQSLDDYAKKTELHSHSNKSVLDGITSAKVTEWNNKSTFDGNYNNLTNKPTIPSLDGYATESYVNQEIEKIDVTSQLTDYATKDYVDGKVDELSEDVASNKELIDRLNGITNSFIEMTNLYNPALQTSSTISPHYYVQGYPYSSTQYDNNYNATALIEVEPNKTYTITLIPSVDEHSVPWGKSPQGIFFYDENQNYIDVHSNGNTFVTPPNTKYIRFNYAIIYGIPLSTLNSRCVLVEGDTLPPKYIPYGESLIIQEQKNETNQRKMFYQTIDGGVYINAPYSSKHDISYYLCKHGANNIFDFYSIGLVEATSPVSNVMTPSKYIIQTSGDWHSPYVVGAVNNADGENKSSYYFTGGNHGYDNTATGVPTGRTDNLKTYCDGKEIAIGMSGYCDEVRIEWDNYVQGYNTTKADGSGREILREHITMKFDGYEWKTETTIYPLEAIRILTWYALQLFTINYDYVAYINGADGLIYEQSGTSECGNKDVNAMRFFNLEDTAIVEIDNMYGLGNRRFASATTKGFFARGSYNKAYGTIIDTSTEFASGGAYSVRGSYIFKYEIQQEPAASSDNDGGNTGGDNTGGTTTSSILKLNRSASTQSSDYLGSNCETVYLNPAHNSSTAVSGTACAVANLTESSITVTENGTGGRGCAFPIGLTEDTSQAGESRYGKSFTWNWTSDAGSNTRLFLLLFGNSNAKYITVDKTGTKTSCTIVISADGNTITVDGVAQTSNGNPFTTMSFFFSAGTGKTAGYTNVSLVENK